VSSLLRFRAIELRRFRGGQDEEELRLLDRRSAGVERPDEASVRGVGEMRLGDDPRLSFEIVRALAR
jgi:hypothetical protein